MLHPDNGWPVLYLDDNPDDHLLLHEAVALLRAPLRIQSVTRTGSVREYLSRSGRFTDRFRYPSPTLVLLDYNLDSETSISLLRWIRAQAQFTDLPVILYSGSDVPACIALSYLGGADHFIVKPAGMLRAQVFLQTLCECLAADPPCYDLLRNLTEHRPPPELASSFLAHFAAKPRNGHSPFSCFPPGQNHP